MTLPKPVVGLVVRYSYLWLNEALEGREEGSKDRPCAIILVMRPEADDALVTVVPITHRAPDDAHYAIEIPSITKQRLGLDGDRSWVVLNEANQFVWPGPDLRPQLKKEMSSVAYGLLPAKLTERIRKRLVELLKEQRFKSVSRSE